MTLTRVRARRLRCALLIILALPTSAKASDPLAVPAQTASSLCGPVDLWFMAHQPALVELYTHLHTHPDLSFQEHETSKRIADELKKAGVEVTTGVGKLGVVGVIKNGTGPVVLVRTDM